MYSIYQYQISGSDIYISTYTNGLFSYTKNKLKKIKVHYPVSPVNNNIREIINFYPHTNKEIYFVTKSKLYHIQKRKVKALPLTGIRGGSRFSAVNLYRGNIVLGTTYNGIYLEQGTNYITINNGLPRERYGFKEFFYDEIRDIVNYNNRLFGLTDHNKNVYFYSNQSWHLWELPNPVYGIKHYNNKLYLICESNVLSFAAENINQVSNINQYLNSNLTVFSSNHILIYSNNKITSFGKIPLYYPYKTKRQINNSTTTNVKGIYINLDFIRAEDTEIVKKLFKEQYINAVVINFKDDTGNLIYNSKIPAAIEAKASMLHPKLNPFLQSIKEYNPYIIVRCVVFKDYRMYSYKSNAYALWDITNNIPWKKNRIEYWVDPYSDFIREYNISVAKEIESLTNIFNISEIQFDYIRLPSDKKDNIKFRYRKDSWERIDLLDGFLGRIAEEISLPISIDIYGYNAIYRMGNWIGQDIETISKYVNIICPMVYPSHFGKYYLSDHPQGQTQAIINFSVIKAKEISFQNTFIRPFLQAFDWQVKNYNAEYIHNQLQGNFSAKGNGYLFWNPAGRYSSLYEFLNE